MKFNLQGFIEVLTFQVSWMEANFFWVLVSFVLYLGIAILLFFLTYEHQGANQRKANKKKEAKAKWSWGFGEVFWLLFGLFVLYHVIDVITYHYGFQ